RVSFDECGVTISNTLAEWRHHRIRLEWRAPIRPRRIVFAGDWCLDAYCRWTRIGLSANRRQPLVALAHRPNIFGPRGSNPRGRQHTGPHRWHGVIARPENSQQIADGADRSRFAHFDGIDARVAWTADGYQRRPSPASRREAPKG